MVVEVVVDIVVEIVEDIGGQHVVSETHKSVLMRW
jgi:hypothetical protein